MSACVRKLLPEILSDVSYLSDPTLTISASVVLLLANNLKLAGNS